MADICGTIYVPANVTDCSTSGLHFLLGLDRTNNQSTPGRSAAFDPVVTAAAAAVNGSPASSPVVTRDTGVHHGLGFDIETVIQLYIVSVLIAFGVAGNIVSIVVLRHDRERRETLFLLQALALADGLYLLAAVMRYPVKHLISSNRYAELQLVAYPLLKTFQVLYVGER